MILISYSLTYRHSSSNAIGDCQLHCSLVCSVHFQVLRALRFHITQLDAQTFYRCCELALLYLVSRTVAIMANRSNAWNALYGSSEDDRNKISGLGDRRTVCS